MSGTAAVHPCYSWLWKSNVQPKHKVFFWLLIKDRLSTRGLLKRKNMELPSYDCVLCASNTEETLEHLFLQCPFAIQCWQMLHLQIDFLYNSIQSLQSFKVQLHVPFFMDVIILLSWCIWMARNDQIFRNIQPTLQRCRSHFEQEFAWVILRAKKSLPQEMQLWMDNFL